MRMSVPQKTPQTRQSGPGILPLSTAGAPGVTRNRHAELRKSTKDTKFTKKGTATARAESAEFAVVKRTNKMGEPDHWSGSPMLQSAHRCAPKLLFLVPFVSLVDNAVH
jgi:hypothetical protein